MFSWWRNRYTWCIFSVSKKNDIWGFWMVLFIKFLEGNGGKSPGGFLFSCEALMHCNWRHGQFTCLIGWDATFHITSIKVIAMYQRWCDAVFPRNLFLSHLIEFLHHNKFVSSVKYMHSYTSWLDILPFLNFKSFNHNCILCFISTYRGSPGDYKHGVKPADYYQSHEVLPEPTKTAPTGGVGGVTRRLSKKRDS